MLKKGDTMEKWLKPVVEELNISLTEHGDPDGGDDGGEWVDTEDPNHTGPLGEGGPLGS